MGVIRKRVLTSIKDINKSEWNAVFGDLPEGYDFYRTLEESGLEQFCFFYIIFHRDKRTLLIAPVFIAEINLDIAIDGPLSKIIKSIRKRAPRFLMVKALFCGSPCGENGRIGIREGLAKTEKEALALRLSKTMTRLSRKKRVGLVIFKDFLSQDTDTLDRLKRNGFFKIRSLPSVTIDIAFDSMDGYLKLLGRSTRKDLRRKLNRSNVSNNIRIDVADNIDGSIDRIYELYLNTYNAGTVKFERLTKEFFARIIKNLGPNARFFLYYVDNRLAAFNLCFIYNDLFIDKFIGFDYDLSFKHNLYFVSWYHNIEWCLKNSIRRYQVGQTDYGPKIGLGGKTVDLYAYGRHRNILLNLLLNGTARLLKL
ncbi:MAG: GNAT family N-acetyltransferase [Candidatus Omnitrophota bacterium]